MRDEPAFLHAVTAAPTDDTARLVYADWLDEHDEPHKAAFLRAECAWAAEAPPGELLCARGNELSPEADRYPPALRLVTELVDKVPPAWFASVSRVAWEVRSLADRFVARVPPTYNLEPMHPMELFERWVAAVTAVREALAYFVGATVTGDRFMVPVDYFAFSLCVGGLWCPDDLGMTYFDALSSPGGMAHETTNNYALWADLAGCPNPDLAACGLWLFVGNCDRHDFHLCCDRASPMFGALVDMHDSHPWISPPHGPLPSEVEAWTFLDFLRDQVARAEGGRRQ